MNEPRVVCTMLTADRLEFAKRALRCWGAQTYRNRELLILDNGQMPCPELQARAKVDRRISYMRFPAGRVFGALRNSAAKEAQHARLILHWDDDEISHPERIAKQVEFHLSSGASVTGFQSLLFWNSSTGELHEYSGKPRFAIGSSLCYSPEVWAREPFALVAHPDEMFVRRHHTMGMDYWFAAAPLLVSEIHARNTSPKDVSRKPYRPAQEYHKAFKELLAMTEAFAELSRGTA